MSTLPASCAVCGRTENLLRCSGCRERLYCSQACQRSDWKTHKVPCAASSKWYDKFRMCDDGTMHEGRLELVTWDCPEEGFGWGAYPAEESAELKELFEIEFGANEERFYNYWPRGFRWTCCGTHARMKFGCDHHGKGSVPCTCDFCRMGRPLPDSIYYEKTPFRHGLTLPRGPDSRSFNPYLAVNAAVGRTIIGLAM